MKKQYEKPEIEIIEFEIENICDTTSSLGASWIEGPNDE